MSFPEENVTVDNRIFVLLGIVTDDVVRNIYMACSKQTNQRYLGIDSEEAIRNFFSIPRSEKLQCFYTSFAYADLYDGKEYDIAYPAKDIMSGEKCKAKILSFINEWTLTPIGMVGHGHRTICLIEFHNGIPDLVREMDILMKGIKEYPKNEIVLCSQETWDVRKGLNSVG